MNQQTRSKHGLDCPDDCRKRGIDAIRTFLHRRGWLFLKILIRLGETKIDSAQWRQAPKSKQLARERYDDDCGVTGVRRTPNSVLSCFVLTEATFQSKLSSCVVTVMLVFDFQGHELSEQAMVQWFGPRALGWASPARSMVFWTIIEQFVNISGWTTMQNLANFAKQVSVLARGCWATEAVSVQFLFARDTCFR